MEVTDNIAMNIHNDMLYNFEDIKEVIRSHKSKDRQYNSQKGKEQNAMK